MNVSHDNSDLTKKAYVMVVIKNLISLIIFLCSLLLAAGTLRYRQAWVFCGFCMLSFIVVCALFADKKDLVKERMRPGPGTKWWDYIFYALFAPGNVAMLIFSAMDACRFKWSPPLPLVAYITAYGLMTFSTFVVIRAMHVNRFFSSTARIQLDRGQTTVQSGPYRYIRHPGYAAGILLEIGMPITLGSLYALLFSLPLILLLTARTSLEDKMLVRELNGYKAYSDEVRYRLIPKIW